MSKHKEALNEIVSCCGHYVDKGWFEEDLALLQQLVDKATPKKPIDSFCPICGSYEIEVQVVGYGWEKQKHCPDCGQAIDWSK